MPPPPHRCSIWRHLRIVPGSRRDYAPLARFHYRAGNPVAVTRAFVARYRPPFPAAEPLIVGIVVESRPVLNCAARNSALPGRYLSPDKRAAARRLNRELRTLSRVVVHPQFRGIGLGEALVRHLLRRPESRFVEALAAMGHAHPLFERAGMRRCENPRTARRTAPVYYLWDRRFPP